MNPLLRYRLATLSLTAILFLVALAYATQTVQVATLRSQKRQLKRLNKEQQEEIARLRLIPANHAVYAFVLSRLKEEGKGKIRASHLEINDEEICATYSVRPGVTSSTLCPSAEECTKKHNVARRQSILRVSEPKWTGPIATVYAHSAYEGGPWGYQNTYTLEYTKGKVRLIEVRRVLY